MWRFKKAQVDIIKKSSIAFPWNSRLSCLADPSDHLELLDMVHSFYEKKWPNLKVICVWLILGFFSILTSSTISENKITVQGVAEGGQFGPFSEGLKQHFPQMYRKV